MVEAGFELRSAAQIFNFWAITSLTSKGRVKTKMIRSKYAFACTVIRLK